MTDKDLGMTRRILKNGQIQTITKDGTSIINGHVVIKGGKEMAAINGYLFEMPGTLNIIEDMRKYIACPKCGGRVRPEHAGLLCDECARPVDYYARLALQRE